MNTPEKNNWPRCSGQITERIERIFLIGLKLSATQHYTPKCGPQRNFTSVTERCIELHLIESRRIQHARKS